MTQSRASAESWRLSECYGSDDEDPLTGFEMRIEREDCPADGSGPKFADDGAAWDHVVTCARAGSAYHARALEACSLQEQGRIIARCGAWK